MNKRIVTWIVISLFAVAIYTQITLFVIQPIGALPEGKTVVILRQGKTNFIDSADAICERIQDGVSLLCRSILLAEVINKSNILLRLPYSETLYLVSTNGKTYDR